MPYCNDGQDIRLYVRMDNGVWLASGFIVNGMVTTDISSLEKNK